MAQEQKPRPYRLPASPFVSPARSVADLAAGPLAAILGKRGFAGTDLMAHWPEIVGRDLADLCIPERIAWPRRDQTADDAAGAPGRGATLHLRVDGPLAIEVQHRTNEIVERINQVYGYAAVEQIRIIQAPLPRKPDRPARTATGAGARTASSAALSGAPQTAAGDDLAAALARLGDALKRK